MNLSRLISGLNIEKIAIDVLRNLKMENLDLYFVVAHSSTADALEKKIVGAAYSERAAKEIRDHFNNKQESVCHTIFKLNMEALLRIVEEMGALEVIN